MTVRGKVLLVLVAVTLVGIQLVPVERTNPPERAPIAGPAAVVEVLEASCFDCHSNRTRWPWYSHVAPVSWQIVHDVSEGRARLNFSDWEAYPEARRAELRREIWEEVSEGRMPVPLYAMVHAKARLDPQELDTLRAWALAGTGE